LPSDPLATALAAERLARSFMGFTALPGEALIGLGVSAIGDAGSAYGQNEKNLQQYEARLAAGELPLQRGHVLGEEDRQIRALLWTLMAGARAQVDDTLHRAPWWPEVRGALDLLARDGLIELSAHDMAVKSAGRAFLRRIGLAFDRYHAQALAV
jgi:oxygen-independent coproporphyrinogen-3 oxidase